MIRPDRHVIIEFAGMPKSGKTTIMELVAHYIRRKGVAVSEYHGGGRYAPVGKADQGKLNLYLACEAVRYCLATSQDGLAPRVHLLDRGLADRLIFTLALERLGRVSKAHGQSIRSMFACPELREQIDLCLVFVTTSALSLRRETLNRLTQASGRVMNSSFLDELRSAAIDLYSVDTSATPALAARPIMVDTAKYDGEVRDTAINAVKHVATALKRSGIAIETPREET